MTRTFSFRSGSLFIADLAAMAQAAGKPLADYPYVVRVLLENLARNRAWGRPVAQADLRALLDWQAHIGADLPLHVARVILPDSSGLPVLQDLAALRDAVAARGGDVATVDTRVPVDLIVDHSLQVDHWGGGDAAERNLAREFQRNAERYRFLKWAQQAYAGLRVFPPGTGIIHQVNLEHIAPVVCRAERPDGTWAHPDFVIGGDSHTPMVNALGVLGWGVGGIDAEAALLGQAYTFPIPRVVGVRLSGRIPPSALTTDAALLITETLRRVGVTACAVEFFGPAVAGLTVPERATIANMAPEYGATCGYFPIDGQTLAYLRTTGRPEEQVALVEAYTRANHLFRDAGDASPVYSQIVEIDLDTVLPGMAGPRRPQDRLPLARIAEDFRARLPRPLADGGFGAEPAPGAGAMDHGSIALAAITSCTNTSNPAVMLAAGIVARKAAARGLQPPAWVKRSLAPGSRTVTRYLEEAGLLAPLAALGFHLIGYGCTTCGGKSGPLVPEAAREIEQRGLVAAAVLSGNRNFEGRIHKLIRANYIGAPPLVVLYALAGRIDIDLTREPVAIDPAGVPVYLRDLWPTPEEIAQAMPAATRREIFVDTYEARAAGGSLWDTLDAPRGPLFPWDRQSHYLVEPPFFRQAGAASGLGQFERGLQGARVLAAFGDSLTTDHISPGGEIPADTPAGRYLIEAGVAPADFNTYVARRGNHEIMARATFANIRIKNLLVPGTEGGVTVHFPDHAPCTIFDAARAYREDGIATVILAGKEYGTGSSRDWAAKGSALLGVKAVLAESFERIHRANLVGMGVLPLAFLPGQGWRQLGLTGAESFGFQGLIPGIMDGAPITVEATGPDGVIRFQVQAQVLTQAERQLMQEGGIPASVLQACLDPVGTTPDFNEETQP
ncbi:aconitate hydratase AcnA [Pigmentiphaga sp. H8]|uniref:aconitate hydratase AcnA n=1 Tax=Pigmentiphaga sp. H8 TaxID=2488560 RepID=UPI000F5B47FC|nr:aconitate hydratase AcnA [Pigmentiphaga sp. H8]AZG07027.1 aconitate hydratase AcnA [Pigmentiphaga sp. H8]